MSAEGGSDIARLLDSIARNTSASGLLSLLALVWTARGMAALFFVYLAASIVLLGAEVASETARVRGTAARLSARRDRP